jgi:two-component system sensor histidine kinase/response regulator
VPDCMVLDLRLPGLDGFSVLEVVRARGLAPRMPVVILSCEDGEKALVRGWDLGAVEYLTKPIDPYVLAAKIAAVIAAAEQRRSAQAS